jgi:predicted PurR-regulated permease PerM
MLGLLDLPLARNVTNSKNRQAGVDLNQRFVSATGTSSVHGDRTVIEKGQQVKRFVAPSWTSDDVIQLAIRFGLLVLLLYWSFELIRPFLPILAWSIVLTVALYPVYDWMVQRLGNRRKLAAVVITLLTIAIIAAPIMWLGFGLAQGMKLAAEHLESGMAIIPAPPDTVRAWPVIGQQVYDFWTLASVNLKGALTEAMPSKAVAASLLALAGGIGADMLKFFAALLAMGFLLAPAPRLIEAVKAFLIRIVPQRSEEFVTLAGATIRSVSQGVIGLSVLYSLVTGLGLQLAGVPGASTLAFLMLLLNILQIGPVIVTVPIVIWAWMTKDPLSAFLLTAFVAATGILEGVLKPVMMGRGLRTPMIVILLGALGGTLAHGVIGLFVGPVILAVAWELSAAWFSIDRTSIPVQESTVTSDPGRDRTPLHP